jgi:hypothetical protein
VSRGPSSWFHNVSTYLEKLLNINKKLHLRFIQIKTKHYNGIWAHFWFVGNLQCVGSNGGDLEILKFKVWEVYFDVSQGPRHWNFKGKILNLKENSSPCLLQVGLTFGSKMDQLNNLRFFSHRLRFSPTLHIKCFEPFSSLVFCVYSKEKLARRE